MSLGFRVGKFCDGGLLDIAYGFISPNFLTSIETNNLSLEFRVGKFRHSGLLDILYGFVIPKIELKYN